MMVGPTPQSEIWLGADLKTQSDIYFGPSLCRERNRPTANVMESARYTSLAVACRWLVGTPNTSVVEFES